MEIKLRVRTPKEQATKTEGKIRIWIIGFPRRGLSHDTYVSPEDDEIIWHIKGDIKDIIRIQKNAARFDWLMSNVLGSKKITRMIAKELESGQEEELKDMLLNQTKVEILKEATIQELDEYNNSWWDRMRKRFNKKEDKEEGQDGKERTEEDNF